MRRHSRRLTKIEQHIAPSRHPLALHGYAVVDTADDGATWRGWNLIKPENT